MEKEVIYPNAWLVKTDANGAVQWMQLYGGNAEEEIQSLVETSDGNFFLVGHTQSYGQGGKDGWVVKTDSNGELIWSLTFGGEDYDVFADTIQTEDGALALVGHTDSYISHVDFWFVKLKTSGAVEGATTYGDPEHPERAYAVHQMGDGGFAIIGSSFAFNEDAADEDKMGPDMWVIRTNPIGTPTTTTTATTTSGFFIPFIPITIIPITITPEPVKPINPVVVNPILITVTVDPLQTSETTPTTTTTTRTRRVSTTTETSPISTVKPKPTTTPETVLETITESKVDIITTSESKVEEITSTSESSQAPVTVTVTPGEETTQINIPGFTAFPLLVGLGVLVFIARKRKK